MTIQKTVAFSLLHQQLGSHNLSILSSTHMCTGRSGGSVILVHHSIHSSRQNGIAGAGGGQGEWGPEHSDE